MTPLILLLIKKFASCRKRWNKYEGYLKGKKQTRNKEREMEKVKVKMKNENMDEENAKEEENLKGL
jgi:hypothetical protein